MSKVASETRTIRVSLNSYLASAGWTGLTFSEGWDAMDIEKPLVNIYVIDGAKSNLELGRLPSSHQLFEKIAQVDVFMESEDRVRSVTEDVMEYMDNTSLTITDLLTQSGIGYLVFPNSETITTRFLPPSMNNPEILRWRGSVRGKFESYYPNGGSPL